MKLKLKETDPIGKPTSAFKPGDILQGISGGYVNGEAYMVLLEEHDFVLVQITGSDKGCLYGAEEEDLFFPAEVEVIPE